MGHFFRTLCKILDTGGVQIFLVNLWISMQSQKYLHKENNHEILLISEREIVKNVSLFCGGLFAGRRRHL